MLAFQEKETVRATETFTGHPPITHETVAGWLSERLDEVPELRPHLSAWLGRCCHGCARTLHDVLEIKRALGGGDAYDAWLAFEAAAADEAALLELPPEGRRAAIRDNPRFATPAVALRLLRRARELVLVDPLRYEVMAETAVWVAAELARRSGAHLVPLSGRAPKKPAADLLARAWAYRANALRITGQFEQASVVMERALRIVRAVVDPHSAAEVKSLSGFLLMDQGHFTQAETTIRAAIEVYSRIDPHLAAAQHLKLAKLLRDRGQSGPQSIALLRHALEHLDPLRDPMLIHAARMNLSLHLLDAGEIAAAEEAWRAVPRFDAPALEARRTAAGGCIALEAGRTESAARAFRHAVESFALLRQGCDAAYLMLFLAVAEIRLQRPEEAVRVAAEAATLFEAHGIRHEKLAALDLVHQAAESALAQRFIHEAVSDLLRQIAHADQEV